MSGLFLFIKKKIYNFSFISIERHSRGDCSYPILPSLTQRLLSFLQDPGFYLFVQWTFPFSSTAVTMCTVVCAGMDRVGGDHAVSTPWRAFPWVSLVSWLMA